MNQIKLKELKSGRVRLSAIVIALLFIFLANMPILAQEATGNTKTKPTIVLVHGAFADPSGWNRVNILLRLDGYTTSIPALELESISGDAAIVRATLDSIPGKKILVGHSYGGVVISNAAVGRSDVLGLVYTAAYVPDEGETVSGLGEGYVPPAFLTPPFPPGHLLFVPYPFAIIDPVFFHQDFAQDLHPRVAAAMSETQHPVSLDILFSPSGPIAWRNLPSWYAVSGADRIIDPVSQRFMAQRAGATVIEFPSASHAGGFISIRYVLSFTRLIELAARQTTR